MRAGTASMGHYRSSASVRPVASALGGAMPIDRPAARGNPPIGPHDRGLGLQDLPNSLSIASRKIALRRV